ncbi:hypothetical protein BKA14_005892 [Actinoplanes abujensis]|uniref:Uncharacterized protein n=1 Tax=Paractinoplanes abujensis TaxID=882441 RepID=A0A7W7CW39_9ACTN|nr:hypothetical protein [Actinoplanes abujensis]
MAVGAAVLALLTTVGAAPAQAAEALSYTLSPASS